MYKSHIRYLNVVIIICIHITSLTMINGQESFSVSGVFHNGAYETVSLIDVKTNQVIVSSTLDKNGTFGVSSKTSHTAYYFLEFGNAKLILIVIPGDSIQLTIDAGNIFENIKVDGSEDTKLVYNTLKQYNIYIHELDTLKKQIQIVTDNAKKNILIHDYQKVFNEKDAFIRKMIEENPNSLATLLFIDNFKIEDEIPLFKNLSDSLIIEYPNNPHVKDFKNRVEGSSYLALGTEAPDITLPNPEGTTVSLSSLRGKIVLIDFWASWCGPCRRENPAMVRIYEKYKDKGFEIYGVSLDNNRHNWIATIATDNLYWTQVSDLKFWNSEVVQLYQIQSIPYTVLLDKKGNIIAKGLRGLSLEVKLEEIFD